jgi:SM-20-related protein
MGSWQAEAFRPAAVGRGLQEARHTEVRSDHILWLEDSTESMAQRRYFARMEAMRLQIEAHLFLGLAKLEAHLALYPVGTFYRRHTDALVGVHTRVLSTVLYLNEDWADADGGALRLYVPSDDGDVIHEISPVGGTLALFLSDEIEHEVLPSSRERLSITGWLLRR